MELELELIPDLNINNFQLNGTANLIFLPNSPPQTPRYVHNDYFKSISLNEINHHPFVGDYGIINPKTEVNMNDDMTNELNLSLSENFNLNIDITSSFDCFELSFPQLQEVDIVHPNLPYLPQSPLNKKKKYFEKAPTKKRLKRIARTSRSVTGCWTCRLRHIKCDEGKPYCHNCSRIGVDCDGYDKIKPLFMVDNLAGHRRRKEIQLGRKKQQMKNMQVSQNFQRNIEVFAA